MTQEASSDAACRTCAASRGLHERSVSCCQRASEIAIASTEAAYAKFFRTTGACCVLMPAFPAAPTDVSDPKGGLLAMFNEGCYTSHLCTVKGAPAIVLPTPVAFEAGGMPVGVMLYGKDDRQMLGVALALEAARAYDWVVRHAQMQDARKHYYSFNPAGIDDENVLIRAAPDLRARRRLSRWPTIARAADSSRACFAASASAVDY